MALSPNHSEDDFDAGVVVETSFVGVVVDADESEHSHYPVLDFVPHPWLQWKGLTVTSHYHTDRASYECCYSLHQTNSCCPSRRRQQTDLEKLDADSLA